jgi:hypothetical protein
MGMLIVVILISYPGIHAANEVTLTVYYPDLDLTLYPDTDTLYEQDLGGTPYPHCLRVNLENDVALGGISLGFRIWSDDGVTWEYLSQAGGWGEGGQDAGFAAATIVAGSRMDPVGDVFDMTGLLVTEQDIDGLLPDSILYGGVSLFGQLDTGPLEPMIDLHFRMSGIGYGQVGTLCFDSCFMPPAGTFIFSNTGGSTFSPVFDSPDCYVVILWGEYENPNAADNESPVPFTYGLNQNHPNPFNPATTIDYSLARKSHVTIAVYNVLGQTVRTLVDDTRDAGNHQAVWDGNDQFGHAVASGVYIYKMLTDEYTETRKMVLMR